MKKISTRLTYANVVASLALFLAIAGGSAFAANQLAKNSVGPKQLKRNAVTAAKLKKGAVTAAKIKNGAVTRGKIADGAIDAAKLAPGTIPAQPAVAESAKEVVGRTLISRFVGEGEHTLAEVGPFRLTVDCKIDDGGSDYATLLLYTSAAGSAMDDNNGDEESEFGPGNSPAELFGASQTTGVPEIEGPYYGGLTAVGPEGTAITLQSETLGINIGGHPGQCWAGGILTQIG